MYNANLPKMNAIQNQFILRLTTLMQSLYVTQTQIHKFKFA